MTSGEDRTGSESPAPGSAGPTASGGIGIVSALESGQSDRGDERPGDFIGPYKLLGVIGEGGFGVVWLAERREPMVQRVALKIIKAGMDTKAVVARFEQERQALAVMDHPNVARVFDAGTTPAGRPYVVMEHVKGESITTFCDRHGYTVRERLELFVPVCQAVQHAHLKGIIHRDIKPSNVLVAVQDARAVPKVIDFGVAKATRHTLTDKTVFTETGQIIGTPEYMSPEQAEMGSLDIDARTDVYSLGVVLYELLTGTLPFDPRELRSKGYSEIQRIIREVEPPTPSKRLTSMGTVAGADERLVQTHKEARTDLAKRLRRELEWIPLKAMRKDRVRRYDTPGQLAEDVERYLGGRPLRAAPESRGYLARKFVRRNRGWLAGASLIGAALAGATGVSLVMMGRAREAEARQEMVSHRLASTLQSVVTEVHDKIATLAGARPVQLSIVKHALATVEPLLKEHPDDSSLLNVAAMLHDRLGNIQGNPHYVNVGDTDAAMASYVRAQGIISHLLSVHPNDLEGRRSSAVLHMKVGEILLETGKNQEALAAFDRGLAEARTLEALMPGMRAVRDLVPLLTQRRSEAHEELGDLEHAEQAVREALALRRSQFAADPTYSEGERTMAMTLQRIGGLLRRQGRVSEALACHKEAIEIFERLYRAAPDDLNAGRDLASGSDSMGVVLALMGRHEEARASYARTLEVAQRVAKADANDEYSRVEMARAGMKLGDQLMVIGDVPGALERYEGAAAAAKWLADRKPEDTSAARWLFHSQSRLADTCVKLGRSDDALAHVAASRGSAEVAGRDERVNSDDLLDTVTSHHRIAFVLMATGKLEDALASAKESLRLAQRFRVRSERDAVALTATASGQEWVGLMLYHLGRHTEALEHFRRALPDARARVKTDERSLDARRDVANIVNNVASCEEVLADDAARDIEERKRMLTSAIAGYREAQAIVLDLQAKGALAASGGVQPEVVKQDLANCEEKLAKLGGKPADGP